MRPEIGKICRESRREKWWSNLYVVVLAVLAAPPDFSVDQTRNCPSVEGRIALICHSFLRYGRLQKLVIDEEIRVQVKTKIRRGPPTPDSLSTGQGYWPPICRAINRQAVWCRVPAKKAESRWIEVRLNAPEARQDHILSDLRVLNDASAGLIDWDVLVSLPGTCYVWRSMNSCDGIEAGLEKPCALVRQRWN